MSARQHQLHRKDSAEIADKDGDRIGKAYRMSDPVLAASSARCYSKAGDCGSCGTGHGSGR